MNIFILLTGYWFILTKELVGDKTLYSVCTLATRYRPLPLFTGLLLAFMLKMGAAVAFGSLIHKLEQSRHLSILSSAVFFAMALLLWLRRDAEAPEAPQPSQAWTHATIAAFSIIFFTEWADAGQLATVTLVAKLNEPLAVWLVAVLAMATKGIFGLLLGRKVRGKVQGTTLRYAAVLACVLLGALSLLDAD